VGPPETNDRPSRPSESQLTRDRGLPERVADEGTTALLGAASLVAAAAARAIEWKPSSTTL
jgi:hypothetical protein